MLLGRCVWINQNGVGIEHPLLELIGQQREMYRGFDRTIFQKDRGSLIGMYVLVEQNIQA